MKWANYSNYTTLTFTLAFTEEDDSIFIMNSIPYTYSRLLSFTTYLQTVSLINSEIKLKILAQSVLGNDIPLIEIKSTSTENSNKAIILDAR